MDKLTDEDNKRFCLCGVEVVEGGGDDECSYPKFVLFF